jgi:hypothetical protein
VLARKKHFLQNKTITDSVDGRTTVPKLHCDLSTVLTGFSAKSKHKTPVMPNDTHKIDICITSVFDLAKQNFPESNN